VTGFSSLRWRFIGGALIWGAGLLLLAHLGSVVIVIGRPAFFGVLHMVLLFSSAIVLMVCGLWLSVGGLKTLTHLRRQLAAVHDGRERQVEGHYPDEVQPLVNDLNALLAHQDNRVREALTKAGNLAHGLKTPLAVLAQEADRAEADGHTELAAMLRQQVDRMRRQNRISPRARTRRRVWRDTRRTLRGGHIGRGARAHARTAACRPRADHCR
jgi:signal transduction histidine kinase